jgi:hypothetical protein
MSDFVMLLTAAVVVDDDDGLDVVVVKGLDMREQVVAVAASAAVWVAASKEACARRGVEERRQICDVCCKRALCIS